MHGRGHRNDNAKGDDAAKWLYQRGDPAVTFWLLSFDVCFHDFIVVWDRYFPYTTSDVYSTLLVSQTGPN
jgi:hypothetical protein